MNSEKKTTNILLIILGATLIGAGVWYFVYLREPQATVTPIIEFDTIKNAEIKKVYEAKEIAIENIFDFLKIKNFNYSIFEDLYEREQYKDLQAPEIIIDTTNNVGNPSPFDIIQYDNEEDSEGDSI